MSETTTITYSQAPAEVIETIEVGGVRVNIIRHRQVTQRHLDEAPIIEATDYEAARAGTYQLLPPAATFHTEATSWAKAGDRQSSTWSRAVRIDRNGPAVSLGRSKSLAGVRTAAKRNLETEALLARFGAQAVKVVGTIGYSAFQGLDQDAPIKVGDVVAARGHGQFRQAVAVKVTPSRVRFLFTTPSSAGHLTFGEGKIGDQVRLVRAVPVKVKAPSSPAVAEQAPEVQAAEERPGRPGGLADQGAR